MKCSWRQSRGNQIELKMGGTIAITRWDPFSEIEPWTPLRWEPLRQIETLQREMNRLFDRFMPGGDGGRGVLAFMPSAEMEETADEIHLKL